MSFDNAESPSRRGSFVEPKRVSQIAQPMFFGEWRAEARRLLAMGTAPGRATWQSDDLFAAPASTIAAGPAQFTVPRAFVELAESVCMHRDEQRHALLYSILWRLLHGEEFLLQRASDPQVARAEGMAREVRRAIHKMRAFVRFREQAGRHVAWFEPAHHVAQANAPFFARRFAQMDWSILTPDVSLHWDAAAARLAEGPGATRADAPSDDAQEDLWRTYYASIFNPARLKVGTMKAEMPMRYWRNLPEADQITSLIRTAGTRTDRMLQQQTDAQDGNSRRKIVPPPSRAT